MSDPFLIDVQELKKGLVIFRRRDVQHKNWYCRIRVPSSKHQRYKIMALKTSNMEDAKEKAFHHDADVRFRIEHQVPVFDKSFEEVAMEYIAFQNRKAEAGQITLNRAKIVESYIIHHLNPYMGHIQITQIGEERWMEYPFWRKKHSQRVKTPKKGHPPVKKTRAGRNHEESKKAKKEEVEETAETESINIEPAKDGTIRQEMMTFRAIMNYAVGKNYIRESQVPKGDLPQDRNRREEFTLQEYRKLHTDARRWIKEGRKEQDVWYRTMAYNFMLIMTNTGMRTMEARNLRWRDVDALRQDRDGRPFVAVNVRGKDKYRELVAASNVIEYFDRIRKISKATKPDDYVFSTIDGKQNNNLYASSIEDLLKYANLQISSSGSKRTTYCFRHTYATFRLMEGIDVYFLAKQMGTSVKMIEQYYGHITPAKNAERILAGIPGWVPLAESDSGEPPDSVNAGAAGKPKPKKGKK